MSGLTFYVGFKSDYCLIQLVTVFIKGKEAGTVYFTLNELRFLAGTVIKVVMYKLWIFSGLSHYSEFGFLTSMTLFQMSSLFSV